jgi:hypothetical protein
MRKLNFLKAIVDFICIMSYITIPLLVLFLGYLFISDDPIGIPININGTEVTVVDLQSKILMVFIVVSYLLIIYSLFLFRKILRFFQRTEIFNIEVIKSFNSIGVLLFISAFTSGIPSFILKFMKTEINFEIGLNPFVMLLSLGLFFMVLSEVFTISKKQKEENELTI